MPEDKQNLRKWLERYKKILSDGHYMSPCGSVLELYDDDRVYIQKQIDQIEMELKNES